MVAAKSRLKKVPNVRQKLHNYKGTPSQRVQEFKIKTVGAIRKAARKGVSKAQSLAKKVAGRFKMPPPVKIPKKTIDAAVSNVQRLKTMQGAVANVRELQDRVKRPPPITAPSPASMKLKGPSRPPPPPPSTIPIRPTIAPKPPMKPVKPASLRGRKLK